jgi:hypothetical protein
VRPAIGGDQNQHHADNPTTRAVMFYLAQFIPQGVPDTYGFNGPT